MKATVLGARVAQPRPAERAADARGRREQAEARTRRATGVLPGSAVRGVASRAFRRWWALWTAFASAFVRGGGLR